MLWNFSDNCLLSSMTNDNDFLNKIVKSNFTKNMLWNLRHWLDHFHLFSFD